MLVTFMGMAILGRIYYFQFLQSLLQQLSGDNVLDCVIVDPKLHTIKNNSVTIHPNK